MSYNFKSLKKTFLLFTPYIKNNVSARKRMGCAAVLILIDIAVASLMPYLSKLIVNSLNNTLSSSVVIFVLLLGFFWILEKTLGHIQDIIFFPVVNATIRDLTRDVVKHIHRLSMSDYQKLSIPEIINCTRRISISARAFIKIFFLLIIPTTIKLIITTIVMIKLGLFGIGLLPAIIFSGVILYKGTQWYVAARESAWHMSDKVIARVNDSILNTKITRFFYPIEIGQVSDMLSTEATLWHKANTRLNSIHIMIGAVLGLATTGILIGGVLAIQNQTLTIGDFILIKGQLLSAFLPLKTLSVEFRQLIESTIDIKKIVSIFEIPIEKRDAFNTSTSPDTANLKTKEIVLKNVIFSYTPDNPIFNNLSLQIAQDTRLGIVGESGSGKSSLVGLIAGLYKPDSGNIFVHKTLHFIPQDLRLFNMTLRDNITYGTSTVSDNTLLKIAEQVGLMNLLNKLPNGFDTLVGEMGANLSGGEKQKVALARALLIKPEILLLDETTHSLDVECEKNVLQNVFLTIPTVIIVSHKHSTLCHVDRLLKVQSGTLLEIDIQDYLGNHQPKSEVAWN